MIGKMIQGETRDASNTCGARRRALWRNHDLRREPFIAPRKRGR
jgi:hypothetical protein